MSRTIVEWCRNDAFLWGKSAHFCPTPSLVPASFGGHSKFFFPSRMTPNDPRMRNEVRMTGTKMRNDLMSGVVRPSFDTVWPSFAIYWGSFQARSCRSVKRGPCVIPSRSKIKRPCNERYFHFGVVPSQKLCQVLEYEMTSEWQRNDIGMTSIDWNDSAMMQEWQWDKARLHKLYDPFPPPTLFKFCLSSSARQTPLAWSHLS